MQNREERNALKEEMDTLNEKFAELTEEELTQVTGGRDIVSFKVDVPTAEETDVVELNTANLIFRGEVLVPADIDIPE